MAVQPMNDDVQIIQHLSDNPNQDDGLSAEQMKEKFDTAAMLIKAYLNGTLVPAVQQLQKALNNGEIVGVDDTLSITGQAADAKKVGDELKKKTEYVLLWANDNRTSSFAAHTENDVSTVGYDHLLVVCGYNTDLAYGQSVHHVWLRKAGSGISRAYLSAERINTSNNSLVRSFREMSVPYERNAITFGGGYESDGKANDGFCIPYYIYGIKGVNNPT